MNDLTKSIINKLNKEELKHLSDSINKAQTKKFGNPLSLRKQEELMSDIFSVKNWQTLLGMSEEKKSNTPENYDSLKRFFQQVKNVLMKNKTSLKGSRWKEYALKLEEERKMIVDSTAWANTLIKENTINEDALKNLLEECISEVLPKMRCNVEAYHFQKEWIERVRELVPKKDI